MSPSHVTNNTLNCDIDSKNSELILETDRNSVSLTVFRPGFGYGKKERSNYCYSGN